MKRQNHKRQYRTSCFWVVLDSFAKREQTLPAGDLPETMKEANAQQEDGTRTLWGEEENREGLSV